MSYTELANNEVLDKTISALKDKGYIVSVANTKEEALAVVKKTISGGSTVMNGSSTTLDQIGYVEYLKSGKHAWKNLHEIVLNESDPQKQGLRRKETTIADYYLGSVHALVENGDYLIASNTGSQLPSLVFNASHLVLVVGTNKVVATLDEAFERLDKHVIPLENERAKKAYGFGTAANMIAVFKGLNPMMGRTVHFVLVNEALGF